MRVAFWNIRGFHLPLKQKGVEALARKREISLLAVLETKLLLIDWMSLCVGGLADGSR